MKLPTIVNRLKALMKGVDLPNDPFAHLDFDNIDSRLVRELLDSHHAAELPVSSLEKLLFDMYSGKLSPKEEADLGLWMGSEVPENLDAASAKAWLDSGLPLQDPVGMFAVSKEFGVFPDFQKLGETSPEVLKGFQEMAAKAPDDLFAAYTKAVDEQTPPDTTVQFGGDTVGLAANIPLEPKAPRLSSRDAAWLSDTNARGSDEAIAAANRVNELLQSGRGNEVTDSLYEMADPTALAAGYDLPLDRASVMARRNEQGFDTELFHYTDATTDFQSPEFYNLPSGDFGFHVGTPEAAYDRGIAQAARLNSQAARYPRYNMYPDKADEFNAAMLAVGEGNPYTLENGTTLNTMQDVYQMFGVPPEAFPAYGRTLPVVVRSESILPVGRDMGTWSPPNTATAVTRSFDTPPTVRKAIDGAPINFAQEALFMQTIPETYAESVAKAYGVSPDDVKRNLPAVQMRNLTETLGKHGVDSLAYDNNFEGRPGTQSLMLLRPGTVRSPFAKFDPRLRHLGNLSAGVAGAAVLPYAVGEPQ